MFLLRSRRAVWFGDVDGASSACSWEVTRMDVLTQGAMFQEQAKDEKNMGETKTTPRDKNESQKKMLLKKMLSPKPNKTKLKQKHF